MHVWMQSIVVFNLKLFLASLLNLIYKTIVRTWNGLRDDWRLCRIHISWKGSDREASTEQKVMISSLDISKVAIVGVGRH